MDHNCYQELPTPPLSTTPSGDRSSASISDHGFDSAPIASTSAPSRPCSRRHPEFWFTDGSVVLAVGDTLFRVHKTFLARHSGVFRDMFSLPQPLSDPAGAAVGDTEGFEGNPGEDLDGCPVVRLHDAPEDVASLLYALYDGPKLGDNSRDDFRVVSGILRLANKYMIDSLRAQALEHLSVAWPSTLEGWDAREEILGGWCGCINQSRYYPNPVEVINLAREVHAPGLLPSAFYDLSRYSLSEIFEHAQRAETSADTPGSGSGAGIQLGLTLSDTQKLVLGKEGAHCAVTALIRSLATEARSNPALPHAHAHTSHLAGAAGRGRGGRGRGFAARHRRTDSVGGRCTAPAACWRDVCELVDLATQHYLFDRERGAADPLYVAEELALLKGVGELGEDGGSGGGPAAGSDDANDADGEGGTCRACARAFEVWARRERERLWRAIPGWFRLDQ
ncbi:hypothetical protein DFH11DRAFT_1516297 [Phellopilus nigrolimitatus]|nr:hypothetical protein DFH11DRAFT_1516297 [Phellopilus nigrolimitatus]